MVNMIKETTISNDEPVYSISIAAKLLGISIQMLRIYEKEGLILPYKKESGQRLYSQNDLHRIECIRNTISEKKISINGIKSLYSVIPCWEYINCSMEEREQCPAYLENTQPCWSYEDRELSCHIADCRECKIYMELADCSNAKEIIKNLNEWGQEKI